MFLRNTLLLEKTLELIADISTVLSILLNLKEEVLIFSTLIYTKERKSSTERVSFFTFTYQLETYESEIPEESDFQQFFFTRFAQNLTGIVRFLKCE